jgi:outer membrane immunogenic protein
MHGRGPRSNMSKNEIARCVAGALIAAGITLGSSFADAADMPAAQPVYSKAPVAMAYDWTGCYVGVHAGGGLLNVPEFSDEAPNLQGGGGLAGGQAGCNLQAGQFVFGLEGEGTWSNIRFIDDEVGLFGSTVRNRWDTDLAVRVGFAVDRALVYGKVGGALGNFGFDAENVFDGQSSGTATLGGLLLGAGFEYAFAPNWSAKLEYNYFDFAGKDVPLNGTDPFTFTESATMQVVKIGLNYRFGH